MRIIIKTQVTRRDPPIPESSDNKYLQVYKKKKKRKKLFYLHYSNPHHGCRRKRHWLDISNPAQTPSGRFLDTDNFKPKLMDQLDNDPVIHPECPTCRLPVRQVRQEVFHAPGCRPLHHRMDHDHLCDDRQRIIYS